MLRMLAVDSQCYRVSMHVPQPCPPELVDSWLRLAATVEDLFGPMPDLRRHVHKAITRGTAQVVIKDDTVVGGMLLSGPSKPQYIHWLAVHPAFRGQGVGSALLQAALAHWPSGEIAVVTFPASRVGGQAARYLYQRHGFISQGATDPAPDGSPRELFVLTR